MADQATQSNPTATEFPRFYVYALIDPTNNNTPFYIGKGTVLRSLAHAAKMKAKENLDNLVELEEMNDGQSTPKMKKIKELLVNGYSVNDFVRVICRELTESHALAVEAMLIQSAYSNLTNLVSGHHAERFRPFGNWQFIHSLDEKRTLYYVYALINPATKVPFYIGKLQYDYWKHTQLILDVIEGTGGTFSLEGNTGKAFHTRSRLFTDAEWAQIEHLVEKDLL